ncbi:MAG: hypothetical protein HC840_01050 [Leptolyngbyaceae cyanobacterium RM2_2_4]|nr:hypothetical protein [Leptolyngbyaceae cyanobacterium RM2_2_4]
MIIDEYGMIISGGDGGDSCHRMFTSYIRLRLLFNLKLIDKVPAPFDMTASPAKAMCFLQPEPGIYIRNPDPTRWYSDPRNFSRDQMTPVICFHALMADSPTKVFAEQARRDQASLLKACLKRYMFSQNIYPNWVDPRTEEVKKKTPDFINIELWGVFARTWLNTPWMPLALPFVLLGDLFLVFSAMFKVWAPTTEDSNGGIPEFRWPKMDDVDDDNMNSALMVTQYVFQTPLSWLARKIYKTFRRKNYGNTEMGETSAIMGAIAYYNRNDNPEMTELARPLVERY